MSDTVSWKKPNGATIETNTEKATIEYCESLGWEYLGPDGEEAQAEPVKPKRGRPKKTQA